jgi:hypothetical protein
MPLLYKVIMQCRSNEGHHSGTLFLLQRLFSTLPATAYNMAVLVEKNEIQYLDDDKPASIYPSKPHQICKDRQCPGSGSRSC